MDILVEGHRYALDNLENNEDPKQILQFIHKMPVLEGSSELKTIHNGTTTEEVIKVLINRSQTLNERVPSREGSIAITKLQEALMWFEERTRLRMDRGVEGTREK